MISMIPLYSNNQYITYHIFKNIININEILILICKLKNFTVWSF